MTGIIHSICLMVMLIYNEEDAMGTVVHITVNMLNWFVLETKCFFERDCFLKLLLFWLEYLPKCKDGKNKQTKKEHTTKPAIKSVWPYLCKLCWQNSSMGACSFPNRHHPFLGQLLSFLPADLIWKNIFPKWRRSSQSSSLIFLSLQQQ